MDLIEDWEEYCELLEDKEFNTEVNHIKNSTNRVTI